MILTRQSWGSMSFWVLISIQWPLMDSQTPSLSAALSLTISSSWVCSITSLKRIIILYTILRRCRSLVSHVNMSWRAHPKTSHTSAFTTPNSMKSTSFTAKVTVSSLMETMLTNSKLIEWQIWTWVKCIWYIIKHLWSEVQVKSYSSKLKKKNLQRKGNGSNLILSIKEAWSITLKVI